MTTCRAYLVLATVAALLFWGACGCSPAVDRPVLAGAALSQAQQLGKTTRDVLDRESPFAVPVAKDLLDEQQGKFQVAIADDLRDARDRNQLVDERNTAVQELKNERNRFWSHKQRIWSAWIIGGWVAAGIAGIVLGKIGLVGPSAFIMRLIPFANVFAFLRDRIFGGNSTKAARVDVVVSAAPARKKARKR